VGRNQNRYTPVNSESVYAPRYDLRLTARRSFNSRRVTRQS